MKTLTIALSLLALASCRAELGHGPFDGRVYQVQLEGGAAPLPDVLIFDGGRFESSACRPYGFFGAPYDARIEGETSSFAATATSPKSGVTDWNGKIQGPTIEGTMKWTDAAGKTSEMRFRGSSAAGLLDGQTFEGMICEGDDTTGDEDTLQFESGGFDSLACRTYGFTISPYTAVREGDAIRFSATATTCEGDQNVWEGTLRGNEMQGTLKHMNKSGKVLDNYRWIAHAK